MFRAIFELGRKTGILERKYPTGSNLVSIPSLVEFQNIDNSWLFESRETVCISPRRTPQLKEKMEHILKGDVLFFSKTWKSLGLDYDWVTNPETGYRYNNQQHWTKIESLSKEAGDIKFVWEKSRFSWLLTVCRFDYHYDEDHAEFAINQILDWIDKNPLNCGPNYKCSQETSLRILNWLFALNFYKKSKYLTESRWSQIMISIYWQTDHVYKNINYSRITVRNNHAITETLTLYLVGLMFPTMKRTDKWKKNGKNWFEKEIDYQIEDDGTFIQDSMNYHRVVIQLLTYAIALADKHGEKFSDFVYDKAYKSVNFLYQCQGSLNGWLPNYGANDGALFFPLSTADYRDYRPQLDALHGLLTGVPLYDDFLEDACWVGHYVPSYRRKFSKIEKQEGIVRFEKSGFYLLRETDTLSFIRCGLFKNNGSTDQLHLDVWYKGDNLLMDGGSYLYNTKAEFVKYFSGTESHNTVMLDDKDQMLKGPRFMWFYPPKVKSVSIEETDNSYCIKGEVSCFLYLDANLSVERTVVKKKGNPVWTITDRVLAKPDGVLVRQLWHSVNTDRIVFNSDGDEKHSVKWSSSYYGTKDECEQIEFYTHSNQIITTIKIKN